MPRAGRVALRFGGGVPAEAWLDGRPVRAAQELSPELDKGTHILVIRLDPAALAERLSLRSADVAFRTD